MSIPAGLWSTGLRGTSQEYISAKSQKTAHHHRSTHEYMCREAHFAFRSRALRRQIPPASAASSQQVVPRETQSCGTRRTPVVHTTFTYPNYIWRSLTREIVNPSRKAHSTRCRPVAGWGSPSCPGFPECIPPSGGVHSGPRATSVPACAEIDHFTPR